MFTQIGILRARDDRVETIYIDNVREGRDLKQVLLSLDSNLTCE